MKLSRNFLCSSELSRNGVDIAWDGNLSAKIKMITAELSVGSQKTIKKEDTTEEIFGYFGINILDNHFPLYGYASDETCRCIAKSSFLTRRSWRNWLLQRPENGNRKVCHGGLEGSRHLELLGEEQKRFWKIPSSVFNLRKTSSASYGFWLPATHSDRTHQFNNWKRRLPCVVLGLPWGV